MLDRLGRVDLLRDEPVSKQSTSKEIRLQEEDECIGGMRQPFLSNMKVPDSKLTGLRLRVELLKQLSSRTAIKDFIAEALAGRVKGDVYPTELDEARSDVLKILGGEWRPSTLSPVRPDLLEAYVVRAGDPERDVTQWLRTGAPFGAINPIQTNSIFPTVPRGGGIHAPVYGDTPAGWSNYKSVEESSDVVAGILDMMVQRGWACQYGSVRQMAEQFGIPEATIPLSKLGLISKVRSDGSVKHRLIWDLRRSQVNEELHQGQRIILPRFRDLVQDALEIAKGNVDSEVHFTVADFSDAFHLIPVNDQEVKYQSVVFRGEVFAFRVLVFGSAVAPTLWGRASSTVGKISTINRAFTNDQGRALRRRPHHHRRGTTSTSRNLFDSFLVDVGGSSHCMAQGCTGKAG